MSDALSLSTTVASPGREPGGTRSNKLAAAALQTLCVVRVRVSDGLSSYPLLLLLLLRVELWCYACDTWHSYGGPTLREWLATLGVPFDLLTMPS